MKNWMKNVIAAVMPTVLAAGIAWASTAVTNSTGTSTSGNAACFDNTAGTSIKDCGIAPTATVSGSGSVLLQTSPVVNNLLTIQSSTLLPTLNLQNNTSPTAGTTIDSIYLSAYDSTGATDGSLSYAALKGVADSDTSGAIAGHFVLAASTANNLSTVMVGGANGVSIASGATMEGQYSFNAGSYYVANTAGVTCSGMPTASFAVTKGIITHC